MVTTICSAPKREILEPEFKHDEIQKILRRAKRGEWLRPKREVFLVTIAAGTTWVNIRGWFAWAEYWALKIDDVYFELHRIRPTKKFNFRARSWSQKRVRLSTTMVVRGSTFLSNEEIKQIGLHYVKCWYVEYSLFLNNCQKLLLAVSPHLVPEDVNIKKNWIAYKIYKRISQICAIAIRPTLYLLGCPMKLAKEYENTLLEFCLEMIQREGTKGFNDHKNNYNTVKKHVKNPNEWMGSWVQDLHIRARIGSYSLAERYKSLSKFPVIFKEDNIWVIKTCRDIDPAGVRRTEVLFRRFALLLAIECHPRKVGSSKASTFKGFREIIQGIVGGDATRGTTTKDAKELRRLEAILKTLDHEEQDNLLRETKWYSLIQRGFQVCWEGVVSVAITFWFLIFSVVYFWHKCLALTLRGSFRNIIAGGYGISTLLGVLTLVGALWWGWNLRIV